MKNQIGEKCIAVGLALIMLGVMMQPAAAWDEITHLAIASELSVPSSKDIRGGGLGIDMFYFLPGKECYSVLAHTTRTKAFSLNMLGLAGTDQRKKAYAYGQMSHHESDYIGHTQYVNNYPSLHTNVEIGVDANVVDTKDPNLAFNVPYGLVRETYKNTYPEVIPPGRITIFSATTVQATAIYIEKALILLGAFNDLKTKYDDFWEIYSESIDESNSAINDPNSLPNYNLYIGGPAADKPTCSVISTSVSSNLNKAKHIKVDPDIRDTANELLRKGAIEVPVWDDKTNEVLDVGAPIVKDKKAFDDAIAELVKKKKGK